MSLTPDQLRVLQQLANAAQQTGQLRAVLGDSLIATLAPPNTEQRIVRGVPFEEVPVAAPVPWLPVSPMISWGLNDRVVTRTDGTAATEYIDNMGFDLPCVAYAISAAVRSTSGAISTTVTSSDALNLFRIQFELTNGRKWQTANVMGGAICGSAAQPRFLGRPGWRFEPGANMLVKITPLVANIQVDVVLWCIETPGNI